MNWSKISCTIVNQDIEGICAVGWLPTLWYRGLVGGGGHGDGVAEGSDF